LAGKSRRYPPKESDFDRTLENPIKEERERGNMKWLWSWQKRKIKKKKDALIPDF